MYRLLLWCLGTEKKSKKVQLRDSIQRLSFPVLSRQTNNKTAQSRNHFLGLTFPTSAINTRKRKEKWQKKNKKIKRKAISHSYVAALEGHCKISLKARFAFSVSLSLTYSRIRTLPQDPRTGYLTRNFGLLTLMILMTLLTLHRLTPSSSWSFSGWQDGLGWRTLVRALTFVAVENGGNFPRNHGQVTPLNRPLNAGAENVLNCQILVWLESLRENLGWLNDGV